MIAVNNKFVDIFNSTYSLERMSFSNSYLQQTELIYRRVLKETKFLTAWEEIKQISSHESLHRPITRKNFKDIILGKECLSFHVLI